MLNTNILISVIILAILFLIYGKVRLSNLKYYKKLFFYLFIGLNIFVFSCFIINYLYAYKFYTLKVFHAPDEMVAEVIFEGLKIIIFFVIFNILYVIISVRLFLS
jgi:hypothetical protein